MRLLLLSLATAATAAPGGHGFTSSDGRVRLSYPAGLAPTHDFAGRALMTGGWRLMWDGKPAGPGDGVVRFTQTARPRAGMGQVTEMLQIGVSRDAAIVARCGTAGAQGGSGRRLPNRMLGGHRWTVWTSGDAGMNQQVAATDLRTVVDGACYAIDRVTYAVKAAGSLPRTAPTQAIAAAQMDAILASVRVGAR